MKLHESKVDVATIVALTTGNHAKHGIKAFSKNLIESNRQHKREIVLGRFDFGRFFEQRNKGHGQKDHVFCHGGRDVSRVVFSTATSFGCTVSESITFS